MRTLTENEIQRAVFSHLRERGAKGIFAFHPKNASSDMAGRKRGIYYALGIEPGIPDVIIFKHNIGHHIWITIYALELKKAGGKLSKQQIETHKRLQKINVIVGVAYGLDDALMWLEGHGILVGKRQ